MKNQDGRHNRRLYPDTRVFCAIELPPNVRAAAEEHIARLREVARDVRVSWERTEKLHITMKFVGAIDEMQAKMLSAAASRAVSRIRPFKLTLKGAGAFPPRGNPRILWLGIDEPSGSLSQLQAGLERECESDEFARDNRLFHPHITIARIRTPKGATDLARAHENSVLEPIEFSVTQLVVMRSEVSPAGSTYSCISRHAFEDGPSERKTSQDHGPGQVSRNPDHCN